jgi:hypothetical protein
LFPPRRQNVGEEGYEAGIHVQRDLRYPRRKPDAPAEAARRSIFVGLQKEADSQAALCQPPDDDDDVVSFASSGSPANAPDDVVAAAAPAPSPSPPLETVQEFLRATVRAMPEESIFGPSDEHAVLVGQPTPPAATNDEKYGGI